MRQLTKEVYEAPLTTKRVVMMESSCMAASGEEIESTVKLETSSHTEGKEFDFSESNWDLN